MLVKVELLGALPSCQAATYQPRKKKKKKQPFSFFIAASHKKLICAARWSIVCAGTGGMTRAGRPGKIHNTPLTDICCGSLAPKCQRGYRPLLSSPVSWWQERGEEGSLLRPSRASLHGPEEEHTLRAVEKMPGARRWCGAAVIRATPRVKVCFLEKIWAILIQTSLRYTLSRTFAADVGNSGKSWLSEVFRDRVLRFQGIRRSLSPSTLPAIIHADKLLWKLLTFSIKDLSRTMGGRWVTGTDFLRRFSVNDWRLHLPCAGRAKTQTCSRFKIRFMGLKKTTKIDVVCAATQTCLHLCISMDKIKRNLLSQCRPLEGFITNTTCYGICCPLPK